MEVSKKVANFATRKVIKFMIQTSVSRRRTSIQLQSQLLGELRDRARRGKTSVSSIIESILMDSLYSEPNEETIAAMEESRSGIYAGTIDMSSIEAFKRSMGL